MCTSIIILFYHRAKLLLLLVQSNYFISGFFNCMTASNLSDCFDILFFIFTKSLSFIVLSFLNLDFCKFPGDDCNGKTVSNSLSVWLNVLTDTESTSSDLFSIFMLFSLLLCWCMIIKNLYFAWSLSNMVNLLFYIYQIIFTIPADVGSFSLYFDFLNWRDLNILSHSSFDCFASLGLKGEQATLL